MSALTVFSGDHPMGACGLETGLRDWKGNPLRVGDIVLTFTVRQSGADFDYLPAYPTVVVHDHDGSFGEPSFFVMGIKDVPLDAAGTWRVIRLKRFEDVVAGEHWREYGFNYRAQP